MISVSMDPQDETGDITSNIIIKGGPVAVAMMLTVLIRQISETQPKALELHERMLIDPNFITEVIDD